MNDTRHFRVACAFWLNDLLASPTRLRELVESSEEHIRANFGNDFHFIAVSGVSGIVLGTMLSQRFNRHLVVVRKQKESRHSGYIVEGLQSICGVMKLKYIIVDDFISTGATIKRMRFEVARHTTNPELVGAYFYNDADARPAGTLPKFSDQEQKNYLEIRNKDL